MKIREICGGVISLNLGREIDLQKLSEFFKDFSVVYKSRDSVKLKKENKEVLAFRYGEILFYGFRKEEVSNIANSLNNI